MYAKEIKFHNKYKLNFNRVTEKLMHLIWTKEGLK